MSHIFISYSSKDRARAERLATILEGQGLEVWWDRTIPPGKTFDQVIERALEEAHGVIVLWSANSVASNWVKAEAAEALRREILVPVVLEEVKLPLAFRRIEAAQLQDWSGDLADPEFQQMLEAVKGIGADKTETSASPSPDPAQPTGSATDTAWGAKALQPPAGPGLSNGLKIGLAAVAAVVAVIVIGFMVSGDDPDDIEYPDIGPGGSGVTTSVAGVSEDDQRSLDLAAQGQTYEPPLEKPAREATVSAPPPVATKRAEPPAVTTQQANAPAAAAQQANPSPRTATGMVTLQYAGDVYGCVLDLVISVGDRTVKPSGNIVPLTGLPLGPASYTVQGQIACPTIGQCSALGSGVLNVVDGAVYDLVWENTSYAQCNVVFVESDDYF